MIFWILLLLLFSLAFVVLYLVFHFKISALIEDYFQKKYRKYVLQDMQEFYREMETYSSIFDSKIKVYKNLIKQQDHLVKNFSNLWDEIQLNPSGVAMQKLIEKISHQKDEHENKVLDAINILEKKIHSSSHLDSGISKNIVLKNKKEKSQDLSSNKVKEQVFEFDEDLILPDNIDIKMLEDASSLSNSQKLPSKETPKKKLINPENNEKSTAPFSNVVQEILKTTGSILGELMGIHPRTLKKVTVLEQKSDILQSSVKTENDNIDSEKQKFLDFIKQRKEVESNQAKSSKVENTQEVVSKKEELIEENIIIDTKKTVENNQLSSMITKDTNDLLVLLGALKEPLRRPSALKELLKQDYTIEQLAQLSQVTESELFATKRIYKL